MGAQDKLVPAATVIANSLNNTKWSTRNTFSIKGRVTGTFKNPRVDAVDFLSSIHAKQLAIADNNVIWNGDMVQTPTITVKQLSDFATDRGIHDEVLPGFASTTIEEWNELQTGISRAYNIILENYNSVPTIPSTNTIENYNRMGLFLTISKFIIPANPALPAIDGGTTQISYADAWNNQKVPADAAYGVETDYIAPIWPGYFFFINPILAACFRYTGKSRWASPYTGWNLIK